MLTPMKHMDHNAYPESLKTKSFDSLLFIARDAQAALAANPDGENAGYYADEINYACMEMHRRREARIAEMVDVPVETV